MKKIKKMEEEVYVKREENSKLKREIERMEKVERNRCSEVSNLKQIV